MILVAQGWVRTREEKKKKMSRRVGTNEEPQAGLWGKLLAERRARQIAESSTSSSAGDETKRVILLSSDSSVKSLFTPAVVDSPGPEETATEATLGMGYALARVGGGAAGVFCVEEEDAELAPALLRHAMPRGALASSAVVISVDLSRLWTVARAVGAWLAVLQSHVESLEVGREATDELRRALEKRFLSFEEAPEGGKEEGEEEDGNDGDGSDEKKAKRQPKAAPAEEATKDKAELGEGVLVENVGVPVVVVGCHADAEEATKSREEALGYTAAWLRRACLRVGAALVFAPARPGPGRAAAAGALSESLAGCLFGAQRVARHRLVDRETLFVPSGWDSQAKIAVEFESCQRLCQDPAAPFESIIAPPSGSDAVQRDGGTEQTSEDDTDFLRKMKLALQTAPELPPLPAAVVVAAAAAEVPADHPATVAADGEEQRRAKAPLTIADLAETAQQATAIAEAKAQQKPKAAATSFWSFIQRKANTTSAAVSAVATATATTSKPTDKQTK